MKIPEYAVDRAVGAFADLDLGDPRRDKRVHELVRDLARAPSASVPAALGGDSKVQAAYRLMNNPRVTFPELLETQAAVTSARAAEACDVFVVHDTTDCAFPFLDPEEIGYLQTGKAGFRAHFSLVVASDGSRRPLGIVAADTIHRAKRSTGRHKNRPSGSVTGLQQDREFTRWWRGIKTAADALGDCASVVHVADRESDSYDLMNEMFAAKQRFIFRVRVDRRGRRAGTSAWETVKRVAARTSGMTEREVPLSRRKAKSAPGMNAAHPPRKMRMARLTFAATRVEIPRPQYLRDPIPKVLELNLVHVVEQNPPAGEAGVEWLLYTTEPVSTVAEVESVVDGYRTRWIIEEFNTALKTGCAYEARQFETRDALLTMLALSLPIACEVLWLRERSRSTPDAPASEVLTSRQVDILHALGPRGLPKDLTVQHALLAVAALGGHLKRNGLPGWKVLQRGMTKLLDYEVGWAAAQAGKRPPDL